MSMAEQLYEWLEAGPTPACDHILSTALEHAEPEYAARIHQILATRGHPLSWAAVAGDYERVCPEIQQQLTDDSERLRVAIVEAMSLQTEVARLSALDVLAQYPTPHAAMALGDALRDDSPAVCEAGARLFTRIVGDFVDQYGSIPGGARVTAPAEVQLARQQIVRVLTEAMRSFEAHWRVEPILTALWFARDLGDSLWPIINNPRARLREVIQERLNRWNEPRMAGFLLTALCDPVWSLPAERLLARWSKPLEVAALLRHSDLLAKPEFRARLADVKQPAWFRDIDRFILQLPPGLRVLVPRWVCAAGLSDTVRSGFLSRWLHRGCPLLRRASVYAIADLNQPDAPRRLEEVADSNDASATFARWWLRDREHRARRRFGGAGAQSVVRTPIQLAERDESAEFALMWKVCRRAAASQTTPLVAALRTNIDAWANHVVAKLQSTDPRDRLLALRVLATSELAPRFKRHLQGLLHDRVVPIRDLARTLMQSIARLEAETGLPLEVAAKRVAPTSGTREARGVDEIRHELLRFLNELLETEVNTEYAADALRELRVMLDEYHAARAMPRQPGEKVS